MEVIRTRLSYGWSAGERIRKGEGLEVCRHTPRDLDGAVKLKASFGVPVIIPDGAGKATFSCKGASKLSDVWRRVCVVPA